MSTEDLIDHSSMTQLYDVSQGKLKIIKYLLSINRFKDKYIIRGDVSSTNNPPQSSKYGNIDTVIVLLKHRGEKVELAEALLSYYIPRRREIAPLVGL